MAGKCVEDFVVGQADWSPGRTLTETEEGHVSMFIGPELPELV